jgi:hypothetical protein
MGRYAHGCSVKPLNLQINAAVTLSYLVLFAMLFVAKYLRPRPPSKTSGSNSGGDISSDGQGFARVPAAKKAN